MILLQEQPTLRFATERMNSQIKVNEETSMTFLEFKVQTEYDTLCLYSKIAFQMLYLPIILQRIKNVNKGLLCDFLVFSRCRE
jgi:hypothetical protein